MKVYQTVQFKERLEHNRRTILVLVNSDPKIIAYENNGFSGGWNATTMTGKEIGRFESLNDIELSINS